MKRNYVPSGKTFRRHDIEIRNKYIDVLCQELQPAAEDVYRTALGKIAGESAEILVEEAREMARSLCAEEDHAALDQESAQFIAELASALKRAPEPSETGLNDPFVERRSKDLARAVVGFWIDLDETNTGRFRVTTDLLVDLLLESTTDMTDQYQTICARFGLEADGAWRLLDYLHALAITRVISEEMALPAEPTQPIVQLRQVWEEVSQAPAHAGAAASKMTEEMCLLTRVIEEELSMQMLERVSGKVMELDRICQEKSQRPGVSHPGEFLAASIYTAKTTSDAVRVGLRLASARLPVSTRA